MPRIAHRREIDGLRAIAILAVVLYHAVGWPSAGFVGVDIFFAISGYLITRLLLREHATTGRIDLVAFYARRVRRILPAVLVVIVAVLGMASLLSPDEQIRAVDSAISAALFSANFFFEFTTGGYFDPSVDSMPLMHVWSLAVEEQFYLVWPALLIAILAWRPKRIRVIIATLGLCSFMLAEIALHTIPHAAFYQMPPRFWEMAAGGFIAASPSSGRRVRWWVSTVSLCVVLAACAFSFVEFPASGALPVVVATSVLLWAIHRESDLGWVGAFLCSKPMVGIGLVSYSFYLWHWPLLAFYRATTIGTGSPQVRIVLCGVALIVAAVSWRYIETPFRRLRPRGRLFAAGAACSVALAGAVGWWGSTLRQEFAAMPHDNPLAVKAENDLPPGWRRCHYQVYSTDFPRPGCETIPGKKASIVLWGDSMAMTWSPLIKEMGHRLRSPPHTNAATGIVAFWSKREPQTWSSSWHSGATMDCPAVACRIQHCSAPRCWR